MDDLKKYNAGRYRNKQRYKDKAKVVSKVSELAKDDKQDDKIIIEESPVFEKRTLESNWYRYEPQQEDDKDSSRDFSILASAPISLGSYFQFKSDKTIAATQDIKQLDNALFQLDINLLNLSIESIPFHIRCGIDEKYFSKHQLGIFLKDAHDSNIKYEAYLKSTKEKSESKVKEVVACKNFEENQQESVDLSETPDNIEKSGSEDLEQWLDDILDD